MFISPMLLDAKDKPFSDPAYIFEPKMDGHRLILSRNGLETRLFTRDHKDCTRQYPELHQVPVVGDLVLDGEVCCTDPESGRTDYELVMDRLQLKKKDKIRAFALHRPVRYYVWDILFLKGRDLRSLPLVRRRAILESVLQENDFFKLVPQTEGNGEELFRSIEDSSMEGIVAKRKGGIYVSRRSHDWLKIIRPQYTDVYIAGYRKDSLGWLIEAGENGERKAAGLVEQGITPLHKKEFAARLQLSSAAREETDYIYITPQLKARVKHRGVLRSGMLREPSFIDFIT